MHTGIYFTPAIPNHWIVVTPEGDTVLVPDIPNGWAGRSGYRGHLKGLTRADDATERAARMLAGIPDDPDAEFHPYDPPTQEAQE